VNQLFRPPSIDEILRTPESTLMIERFGRPASVQAIRQVVARLRTDAPAEALPPGTIAERALAALEDESRPSQRPVFNLTGTVVHTNLGRSLLPESAIEAVVAAMRGPTNLEYDVARGQRGERDDHVRGLVRELTGAEDAILVNNNAAAILLVHNTLAKDREAIVSRGELIEIGGAFRMPDIMARAGARLREVGTTNRTHLKDYAEAIGPDTGLVMKVHTSNYLIQGFTAAVPAPELAKLARDRGLPFVDDLGSGTLIDLSRYGLRREPTVQDALQDGADLVTFSGDKLLGGPQAGIVAGRRELVARLAKNPLKRALRLDKLRLAALEAVLRLYRDPDRLPQRLPTLRLLTRREGDVRAVAERVLGAVSTAIGPAWSAEIAPCSSQIGSGALPLEELPSAAIAIRPAAGQGGGAVEDLATAFRALPVPVIGRIRDGALLLDLRCLEDEAGFLGQLTELDREAAHGPS
jgi:L-seryl-tRNA(Ser) seleniumtransferase